MRAKCPISAARFEFISMSQANLRTAVRTSADADNVILQRFQVNFEYPVYFTRDVFDLANPLFADALSRLEPGQRQRFVCYVDDGLAAARPSLCKRLTAYAEHFSNQLELLGEPRLVPGGEGIKNDAELIDALHREVYRLGVDRHSYVVGIGGGAVLDFLGYMAATAHRGVRHVRVPTTVLAQDDSGVGVKNGVNAFGVKNFVGTFSPPFAVINDLDLLDTLDPRDKRAGMAEAVKVSLIRDPEFFDWMEANARQLSDFEADAVEWLIRRCAELHMRHIGTGGDPFEVGSARPLDFGHWAAHKLESLTAHALRHGEAVAIGMALDTRYSVAKGHLSGGSDDRICRLLEQLGFRLWHPALGERGDDGVHHVLRGLREFREHLGGELTITLLDAIGTGTEVHEMDDALILDSIAWLEARDRAR